MCTLSWYYLKLQKKYGNLQVPSILEVSGFGIDKTITEYNIQIESVYL